MVNGLNVIELWWSRSELGDSGMAAAIDSWTETSSRKDSVNVSVCTTFHKHKHSDVPTSAPSANYLEQRESGQ